MRTRFMRFALTMSFVCLAMASQRIHAEGWGNLSQKREESSQLNRILLRHGRLNLAELALEVPSGKMVKEARVTRAKTTLTASMEQTQTHIKITLEKPLILLADQALDIRLYW